MPKGKYVDLSNTNAFIEGDVEFVDDYYYYYDQEIASHYFPC